MSGIGRLKQQSQRQIERGNNVCELISEEIPSIKILLTSFIKRTGKTIPTSRGEMVLTTPLHEVGVGKLIQKEISLGNIEIREGIDYRQERWWHFYNMTEDISDTAIFFKNDKPMNYFRYRSNNNNEANRILLVNFGNLLYDFNRFNPRYRNPYIGNRDLIKAADGFWSISDKCLTNRVFLR